MPVAVKAKRLIDGSGAAPIEGATILIENGRFTKVITDPSAPVPEGFSVIDASKYTVLPGLIDCHLHISSSGDPDARANRGMQEATAFALSCYANCQKDLLAGFTTIRDASCQHFADVAVRDAINSGRLPGPRLWVSGLGITSTTGHMDRSKNLPSHIISTEPTGVADSPDEARRKVRLNLKYDVDIIKINASLTEHVRRYMGYSSPEMTREVLMAIIGEAHMHGRRVTAHCYGGDGATWAIEAGLDVIDHGFYLDDRHLDMMAEKGVFLCPTLSVVGRFREMKAKGIPADPPRLGPWRDKAIANAWNTVGRAKKAGVKIACGTDCAMPYVVHGTNAYELEMLTEAGLTPMEALKAALSSAAEAIGFEEVGSVAPGKYADLVFVDGDPLEDVKVLQDMSKVPVVIKGGEVVVDRRPACV